MKKAAVFVYGDIGRSPRMQNHAQQLSQTHEVYFFGYFQTSPRVGITRNQKIHLKLTDIQKNKFLLICISKNHNSNTSNFIPLCLQAQKFLIRFNPSKSFIKIYQKNPPSIPNLFALWLASFIGKYQIYIDFHNYGFTILNMRIKNKHIIKLAQIYEKFFGRKSVKSFCVSNKMKEDLKQNWNIDAITLYDRPLKRTSVQINKSTFFKKYNLDPPKQNQLLLVSSTSWTKDEDFSILLDALQNYEKSASQIPIRALITGKGPEKQRYLKEIDSLKNNWQKISITSVWLEADDYPVLLSLCDLGVCLHYSSSGFDLPMKVVDMFGAGIPVLAINYKTLNELLKHNQNGLIFESSEQLSTQLIDLVKNSKLLKKLKQGAMKQKDYTWDKEWKKKFYS